MTMRNTALGLLAAALLLGCGAVPIHDDDARDELRSCRQAAAAAACVDLGDRYVVGDGVYQDLDRARELYTRACRNDHRDGCVALGLLGLDHPESGLAIDEIVHELGRSCRRYHIYACDALIELHEDPDGGVYDVDQAELIRTRLCADGFDLFCDRDTDLDGLMDSVDECPLELEDIDGFEDVDGCPDPDNDGDEILDSDDACPDEAEDFDEFSDDDGCPDPDNDGDGIVDGDDVCPLDAEDFDGFEDDDGCPEEGTGLIQLTCEAIVISDKVYFDSASDVIQSRSFELLNQVATVVRNVSYIRLVEVAGHTDNRGGDELNLDLSQRRAESVVRFLTESGVPADRLSGVGYGAASPLVPNTSTANRAQNRRVEFRIVEQDAACADPVESPPVE